MKRKGQFFIISAVVVVILLMSLTNMLSNDDNQDPAIHLRDINDALRVLENTNYELSKIMSILSDDNMYVIIDSYLEGKKTLLRKRGYLMNYYINESENTIKLTYDINSIHMEQIIPILEYNRISAWDFDEGVGVGTKDKTGINDGELINFSDSSNSGWTDSCISGNCLVFDGVDDYVDMGNDTSLTIENEITISVDIFLYSPSVPNIRFIVRKGTFITDRNYIFFLRPDNRIHFGFSDSGSNSYETTTFGLENNVWYNLVVTHVFGNASSTKIYIDGNSSYDQSWAGNGNDLPDITTTSLIVGMDVDRYYFNGTIDNLRIYNKSLTAEQVQFLYSNGRN